MPEFLTPVRQQPPSGRPLRLTRMARRRKNGGVEKATEKTQNGRAAMTEEDLTARKLREAAERAEANKALTRRLYEEVYNRGNVALVDELYAPDVELHIAGILEDPFGPEPIKQLVSMTRMAFPSVHATVDDLIAAEDRVAAQVSFTGAFQGVGMGTSPRANLSWWRRTDVYRIVNGRIVEQWGDRDDFTMLQRLGVAVPAFNDPRPTPREFGRL